MEKFEYTHLTYQVPKNIRDGSMKMLTNAPKGICQVDHDGDAFWYGCAGISCWHCVCNAESDAYVWYRRLRRLEKLGKIKCQK